jgi:NAD(P)-dependent dehydrogenase (short-subunit alcohol dehydrogenase family)
LLVSSKGYKVHDQGGILITGFDGSKIAMDLAKALKLKGYTVFAGCHNNDIKDTEFTVVKMDVANEQSIARAKQLIRCKLAGDPLVAIIHCAGTAVVGPIEDLTKQDLETVYAVNTIGPCLVTSSFLDLLRESEGRVVFMSSVSGWIGSPLNASFSSSKLALEAIADSLRIEMIKWKISVSIIELGNFYN